MHYRLGTTIGDSAGRIASEMEYSAAKVVELEDVVAAQTDDVLRRVPPQNIEAEQSVLGAVLLENEAINQALEILTADDFYRETHREIFRAMMELSDHNQPVDAITLTDALRTKSVLEQIGGPAYIAELADAVPTAANVSHYARIVREKAVLRSLATIATDIASSAYEANANVDEFLDTAEHRIFEISERRIKPSFHTMPELTRESLRILERLYENRELVTGVPTGFMDLDTHDGGASALGPDRSRRPSQHGENRAGAEYRRLCRDGCGPRSGRCVLLARNVQGAVGACALLCSEARVDSAKARVGLSGRTRFSQAGAGGSAAFRGDRSLSMTIRTPRRSCSKPNAAVWPAIHSTNLGLDDGRLLAVDALGAAG